MTSLVSQKDVNNETDDDRALPKSYMTTERPHIVQNLSYISERLKPAVRAARFLFIC